MITVYDVWAEWCPPCKKFAPIFEKVANKNPDVDFVKVNADEDFNFLNTHSIRSIPTILIVDSEKGVVFEHTGILTEPLLQQLVNTYK